MWYEARNIGTNFKYVFTTHIFISAQYGCGELISELYLINFFKSDLIVSHSVHSGLGPRRSLDQWFWAVSDLWANKAVLSEARYSDCLYGVVRRFCLFHPTNKTNFSRFSPGLFYLYWLNRFCTRFSFLWTHTQNSNKIEPQVVRPNPLTQGFPTFFEWRHTWQNLRYSVTPHSRWDPHPHLPLD
jgi:hypothetical protein